MIMNKKCMKCGKPATHKFVRIEKNQIYDMYFCQEHAQEKSPYQKKQMPLHEILANFLSQEQATQQLSEGELDLKCDSCGLTFQSYRKTFLLGCPSCYDSFREQLLPELRKFHGNIQHVGRKRGGGREEAEVAAAKEPLKAQSEAKGTPKDAVIDLVPDVTVEKLTKEMSDAIAREDFEKAALCRDQIRDLKAKQG